MAEKEERALMTNLTLEVRVVEGRLFMYLRNINPLGGGITLDTIQFRGTSDAYEEGSDDYGRYMRWELSPLDMRNGSTFAVEEMPDGVNTRLREL